MKYLILLIFGAILLSCDSVAINYQVNKCMEHNWYYKGVHKVIDKVNLKITMKNVETGEKIKITGMDRGWKEVPCPQ